MPLFPAAPEALELAHSDFPLCNTALVHMSATVLKNCQRALPSLHTY
jgi:hypothetical protein